MARSIDEALDEIQKRNLRNARRKANLLAQKRAVEHAKRVRIGEIAEEAGILNWDENVLRGAMHAIADRKGQAVIETWKQIGVAKNPVAPSKVKAILTIPAHVLLGREQKRLFREAGLRRDDITGEWRGKRVDPARAEALAKTFDGKLETFA